MPAIALSEPATSVEPSRFRWLVISCLVIVSSLIVIGQLVAVIRGVSGDRSAAAIPRHGPLRQRISAIVADSLGPSDRGVRRYRIDSLSPGRVLTVTWSINNDVSNGTVGDGAAADVYGMLYNLATHVSLKNVHLTGTYPLGGREQTVMRLDANQHILHLLHSVGTEGLDPQSLWPLLRRDHVNPALAPSSGE